jgi:uncharacterized protein
MANALASETSPYLRQHAENPVDWLPWGAEALARARDEDKPLLVSIGYSSCHWCHVMERESFEDARAAQLMNENFVCVKVDREERPDVDALYMEAVQAMTGSGGWPLNVFLTPDGVPFYGGTYFPPSPRPGMPAWTQLLSAVAEAWSERREEITEGGERLRAHLRAGAALDPSREPISRGALDAALARLHESFDPDHGGFGGAPKFPPASAIDFLLLRGEREMALQTLHAMARGGIHDQLGGGFSRYSVDGAWEVPHFEKMLYDNALLARAYLHGWQHSGERYLLEVCLDTLGWALREMRGPEGGFYSALDADSEGVEGRFYVWTTAELQDLLGEDADAAIAWFGASEEGNFTDPHDPTPGLNVLQGSGPRPPAEVRERIRARLLSAREQRVRPGLDSKRLTAWNALMISALAEAGSLLRDARDADEAAAPALLEAALACAEFILGDLRDEHGRLLRVYNDGQAKIAGYLEDHAFLLEALIALFEATCEERWLAEATSLAEELIARFADPERGGFFSTAADLQEALIVRRKELEDTPIPAGGSSAALGLLRLAQLTGEQRYEHHAVSVLRLLHEIAPRHPAAFGALLQALHWYLEPARPIACALPPAGESARRAVSRVGSGAATPPEPGRAEAPHKIDR